MSRLERLLNLTAALLTAPRPLTVAEVGERVPGYPEGEAFRRAFERDKAALRDMGIPLTVTAVPGTDPPAEGYVIPRDQYELRDPGLEPDELAALRLATVAVHLEGLRGTEAFWKLGGAPGDGDDAHADAVAAVPTIPQLVPLFRAVGERRWVRFAYRGSSRCVDPYRLSFSRGHWYLDGWDHDRKDERQFRLDRLQGDLEVGSAGSFERPASVAAGWDQPWEIGGDEPVEARLLIHADQAGWAIEHLGPEAVVATGEDGSVELALTVSNRDAFRSFVLGFLDHAEVLDPPELRAGIVAWLEDILEPGRGIM